MRNFPCSEWSIQNAQRKYVKTLSPLSSLPNALHEYESTPGNSACYFYDVLFICLFILNCAGTKARGIGGKFTHTTPCENNPPQTPARMDFIFLFSFYLSKTFLLSRSVTLWTVTGIRTNTHETNLVTTPDSNVPS